MNAFSETQPPREKFLDDNVEGGELLAMPAEEPLQFSGAARPRGVGVDADGPQAFAVAHRRPKLLRDKGDTIALEGDARKAVGKIGQALLTKRAQRSSIEAVVWRHEEPRRQALTSKH